MSEPPATGTASTDACIKPCSAGQRRLWFETQIRDDAQEEGVGYCVPLALSLGPDVDLKTLDLAFLDLAQRHPVLRTTYDWRDGDLCQIIRDAERQYLGTPIAVGDRDRETRHEALLRRLWAEVASPFDLQEGPPLRAQVFRTDDGARTLLLCIHHIATDRQSGEVILRDLAEFYEARRLERTPRLPVLTLDYGIYADLQHAARDDSWRLQDLAAWADRLRGAPTVLTLPRQPSPHHRSFAGRGVSAEICESDRIKKLANTLRVSSSAIVIAACAAVLSRRCGQSDLLLGVPMPNRMLPGSENAVGFFANVVPIRIRIDEGQSFSEHARRVFGEVADAYENQALPLADLVDQLIPNRQPGVSPLIQCAVALDEREVIAEIEPLGSRFELPMDGDAHLELTFMVGLRKQRADSRLYYRTGVLEPDAAQSMVDDLATLLDQALDQPKRPLRTLSDCSASQGLLWAQGGGGDVECELLLQRIRSVANRSPHACALWRDGRSVLDYGELSSRAERIGAALRSIGIGPGNRVGAFVERDESMSLAMFGIWAAGAVYVPLATDHPPERLEFVRRDAKLGAILTDGRPPAAWAQGTPVVDLRASEGEAHRSLVMPHADDVAYVMYTSGSTGQPKGVAISHRAIRHTIEAYIETFKIRPSDALSWMSPTTFDASLWETLPALAAGARVVVVPSDVSSRPEELWDFFAKERVTVALMISSVLASAEATAPERRTALRVLQTGGERVLKLPATEPCPLYNVYGPTECAIVCTAGRVSPEDGVHIGRPFPRVATYLLDDWLRPVPPGVPGEVYIGGAGVGEGYIGRTGLTAARFCPDVFAADGTRMYRTGDRARWRSDGVLEFIGRFDNQVKLRGHRIELGEVEAAIAACDAVSECVVLVRSGGAGGERLVAWWVAYKPTSEAVLRDHVAAVLPNYMVPAVFVELGAMPRSRNGKLDIAALPQPELTCPSSVGRARMGHNTPEDIVADAWCEVLSKPQVSDEDDFFALGGHSVLAARTVTLVGEQLGCRIPVVELFEHPKLREFATAVAALAASSRGDAVPDAGGERE